ncbi:hypothetical protein QS413_12745 [Staphylococcus pseudintermedius]|nr:hypothetical protein [Staphylococcus pseudintermedius]WMZ50337.1 hypothetical protein QS413_12745 [Staphylococcus pseudintermedius]
MPQTKDPNVPPGTTFEIPPAGIPEGWTAEVDPSYLSDSSIFLLM